MRRSTRSLAIAVAVAGSLLAGCGEEASEAEPEAAVTIDESGGSDLHRLTLSESAIQRLAVSTVEVTEDRGQLVIPYSSLLYDATGATWTYTNPEGLVFVRAPVVVDRIDGEAQVVRLEEGPPAGTLVVEVGAAELWGAETGVGGGH
jgi:hypothetical protein